MDEPRGNDPVALVLAGGCARGAYEFGALSVLLPKLEAAGQRPRILVGTSVGALNATYLAANAHLGAAEAVADGEKVWRSLAFTNVAGHLISVGTVRRVLEYAGQVLGLRGARLRAMLDPAPLAETVSRHVDFAQLALNIRDGRVLAAGVLANSARTHRTVAFHHGGGTPASDPKRLIDYVHSPLQAEHVLASTAMPIVFPAVSVREPEQAAGWYYDGGTRINAPTKPARAFGAKRLVVIGLSSVSPGSATLAGGQRPDLFAGIGMILQGLFGDRLVQEMHALAKTNVEVRAGRRADHEVIPYILIAPAKRNTIERLAREVFEQQYRGLGGFRRSIDIKLLGRFTGADAEVANATLLSLLLFDPAFIESLIEHGARDARRWLDETHDGPDGLWQISPLEGTPELATDASFGGGASL